MSVRSGSGFTGSLFASRAGMDRAISTLARGSPALTLEILPSSRRWFRLVLRSEINILGEPPLPAGIYEYEYLLREGEEPTRRFLLVARHADLISHLLGTIGVAELCFAPPVRVAALVHRLAKETDRYVMTAVFGRVDGFGQSLRAIALYGSDLSEAGLFHTVLGAIKPYRVQLRESHSLHDAISISAFGEVSFLHRSDGEMMREIDHVLAYLNRGWVDWPIAPKP